MFSPRPAGSSFLSLSSSGTLLSDPFLLEERAPRCSLGSRPLPPVEWYAWPTACWMGWAWLCCGEAWGPWELLGLAADDIRRGRGLLAWARV